VSFFWPFKADYWVIGLDPNYRWAVVGNPDRKYLRILVRPPGGGANLNISRKRVGDPAHRDVVIGI
jgi:lipocalin